MNISDMQFEQGQELSSIQGPVARDGSFVSFGTERGDKIWVVFEAGQMSGVPWAYVERPNGLIVKVNLAMMETVTLKETQKRRVTKE